MVAFLLMVAKNWSQKNFSSHGLGRKQIFVAQKWSHATIFWVCDQQKKPMIFVLKTPQSQRNGFFCPSNGHLTHRFFFWSQTQKMVACDHFCATKNCLRPSPCDEMFFCDQILATIKKNATISSRVKICCEQ